MTNTVPPPLPSFEFNSNVVTYSSEPGSVRKSATGSVRDANLEMPDGMRRPVKVKIVHKHAADQVPPLLGEREQMAYQRIRDAKVPPAHLGQLLGESHTDEDFRFVLPQYGRSAADLMGTLVGAESQKMIVDFLFSGSLALQELASLNLASRDPHPNNFLLRIDDGREDGDVYDFVAIDFGHSNTSVSTLNTLTGMRIIQHPRLLVAGTDDRHAGLRDDLFSLGVSAWILATGGKTPWIREDGSIVAWTDADADLVGKGAASYGTDKLALSNSQLDGMLLKMIADLADDRKSAASWQHFILNLDVWRNDLAATGRGTGQPRDSQSASPPITRTDLPPLAQTALAMPRWPPPAAPHGIARLAQLRDFRPEAGSAVPGNSRNYVRKAARSAARWMPRLVRPAGRWIHHAVIELIPIPLIAAFLIGVVSLSNVLGERHVLTAGWIGVLPVIATVLFLLSLAIVINERKNKTRTLRTSAVAGLILGAAASGLLAAMSFCVWAIESWTYAFFPYIAWRFEDWSPGPQGSSALFLLIAMASILWGVLTRTATPICIGVVIMLLALLLPIPATTNGYGFMGRSGLMQSRSNDTGSVKCDEAVPLTNVSSSVCVTASDSWSALSAAEYKADAFVTAQHLAEAPVETTAAVSSAATALVSKEFSCLTVYPFARVDSLTPNGKSPFVTTNVIAPTDGYREMPRLTEGDRAVRLNLGGIPYDVYDDVHVIDGKLTGTMLYRASAAIFGDGIWSRTGSRGTEVGTFAVFRSCDANDRGTADHLTRTFISSLTVSDRPSLDALAFRYDDVALTAANLEIGNLQVPAVKGLEVAQSSGVWETGTGNLAKVWIFLGHTGDGLRPAWASVQFSTVRSSKFDEAKTPHDDGWMKTPIIEVQQTSQDPDDQKRNVFWLVKEVAAGEATLYVSVEVHVSGDLSRAENDSLDAVARGTGITKTVNP